MPRLEPVTTTVRSAVTAPLLPLRRLDSSPAQIDAVAAVKPVLLWEAHVKLPTTTYRCGVRWSSQPSGNHTSPRKLRLHSNHTLARVSQPVVLRQPCPRCHTTSATGRVLGARVSHRAARADLTSRSARLALRREEQVRYPCPGTRPASSIRGDGRPQEHVLDAAYSAVPMSRSGVSVSIGLPLCRGVNTCPVRRFSPAGDKCHRDFPDDSL